MPNWENIGLKRKFLKRKESYNEFGKRIRFEPLESIPRPRKDDPNVCPGERPRETLVWKENHGMIDQTTTFITLARDMGFSEEQALYILNYENFDERSVMCDIGIYSPMLPMSSEDSKWTIRSVLKCIRGRIESGKNRDLNQVLFQFPSHSIGELLDFYAHNRLYIKKKTSKAKINDNSTTKNAFLDIYKYIDYGKCGRILKENFFPKKSFKDLISSEILEMDKHTLDMYLCGYEDSALDNISLDTIVSCLNKDYYQDEDEEIDISAQLTSIFNSLDEIEGWMKPIREEDFVRHKWDNMDISLLLLGLQKFGLDFERLSEVIGSKTPLMVESFYLTFKSRYGLDQIEVECE